jgi:8-oxo-dGTP pyrophosphatase MutT (NUDIX family)
MKAETLLAEYREKAGKLRQATLCFLVKEKQVLLAMKKRGFAAGKWNGAGGKMDERDKTIKDAAIRETQEEIGVIPVEMKQAAVLNFYHVDMADWGQQVTVYLCGKWEGEPAESEEMAPRWFDRDKLPYENMWDDDRLWLDRILNGEILEADFLFDENQKMTEKSLRGISNDIQK